MNKEKLVDYLLAEYNKRDKGQQNVKNFLNDLAFKVGNDQNFNKNHLLDYLLKLYSNNKYLTNIKAVILNLIVKMTKGDFDE